MTTNLNYIRTKTVPIGFDKVMDSVSGKTYNQMGVCLRSVFKPVIETSLPLKQIINLVTDYVPEFYFKKFVENFIYKGSFTDYQDNQVSHYLTNSLRHNSEIPSGVAQHPMNSDQEKRFVLMYIVNNPGLFDRIKHLWDRFAPIDVAWVCLYTLETSLRPVPSKGIPDRRDLFVSERGKCYSIRGVLKYHECRGCFDIDEVMHGKHIYDPAAEPLEPFSEKDRRRFIKLFFRYEIFLATPIFNTRYEDSKLLISESTKKLDQINSGIS